MLDWIRTLLQAWSTQGERHHTRIVLTDQGFEVIDDNSHKPVVSVPWDAVRSIRAYKRDLFTVDCICLAFQIGDDQWVEITEEEEGFDAVQQKIEEVFPGIPESWWHEVAFPAFATRETVLYPQYERRWPCAQCGYDLTGNVSGTCPECGAPAPTPQAPPEVHPQDP